MYFLFDAGRDIFSEGHITHVPNIVRVANSDDNPCGDNVMRDFLRC